VAVAVDHFASVLCVILQSDRNVCLQLSNE
jgi:hypothetical protein